MDGNVTIREIERADRRSFEGTSVTKRERSRTPKAKLRLREVLLGSLWSDPDGKVEYTEESKRGAGSRFGPKACQKFLKKNSLKMVIRSHEVCKGGYATPLDDSLLLEAEDGCPMLVTIFSASNYSKSSNKGAVLRFTKSESGKPLGPDDEICVPGTNLRYTVMRYSHGECLSSFNTSHQLALTNIILGKRDHLSTAFAKQDNGDLEYVTVKEWGYIMESTLNLNIDWEHVRDDIITSTMYTENQSGELCIYYNKFLNDACIVASKRNLRDSEQTKVLKKSLDQVYRNHSLLAHLFWFLDTDKNGSLSREELKKGFHLIDSKLPDHESMGDADHLMDIMDINHDGEISYNEFLESFRLVNDSNDNKGVLEEIKGGESVPYLQTNVALTNSLRHLQVVKREKGKVRGVPYSYDEVLCALFDSDGEELNALSLLKSRRRHQEGCSCNDTFCTVS